MRRIVEIGVGSWTQLDLREDDYYIACDPFLDRINPKNLIASLPMQNYSLDTIAIAPKDQQLELSYLENSEGDIKKCGIWSEDMSSEDLSQMYPDCHKCCVEVKALSLDTWLSQYAHWGVTETIDYMHITLQTGLWAILDAFSFDVKPKVIHARHNEGPNRTSVENIQQKGYTIWSNQNPFLAIAEPEREHD